MTGIDDKLSKKLLDFINVMTNAYETFKGSTIAEKREFLNFVFANLTLKGGKVHHQLAFPFCELEKLVNCPTWRGVVDNFRTELTMKMLIIAVPIEQFHTSISCRVN